MISHQNLQPKELILCHMMACTPSPLLYLLHFNNLCCVKFKIKYNRGLVHATLAVAHIHQVGVSLCRAVGQKLCLLSRTDGKRFVCPCGHATQMS